MKELKELVEQAKEMAVLHGSVWSSALCETAGNGQALRHHAIISDEKNDFVIDTGSDTNEASWLCDYLELCSPANILAIAEAFRALKQRAEAAEAKLAELDKQEPVVEVSVDGRAADDYTFNINKSLPNGLHELFTRPAPAINLAELVPDERLPCRESDYDAGHIPDYDVGHVNGWNYCRAELLRKIKEESK